MNGWLFLGICLVGVVALIMVVCLFCYLYTFFNFRKKERPHRMLKGEQYEAVKQQSHDLIVAMEKRPFRQVTIRAADGKRLWGRYYHVADGAPLQIQVHGYKGSALRDMCGANHLALKLGHNTLVIDQRAHGKSGGRTISFGEREQEDVLCWLAYARETYGQVPILLSGVSMGAATVLLAGAHPQCQNVAGIIADSPYSSAQSIIAKVTADMHLPPRLVMPFIWVGARLYGRMRLQTDVVAAVAQSRVPMLIIHGEDDRFVPCSMSRTLAAHNPLVTLHTFPAAGHGLSYMTDYPRYRKAVYDFLKEIL